MAEKRASVLVFDDGSSTAANLSSTLAGAGFQTRTARDPSEAVTLVATGKVDFVFLDTELKGVDPFQALRLLRSAQSRRYLPVLLISAAPDRETRLKALRIGFDDVFAKSWDSEELVERVRQFLRLRLRFDELADESAELQRQAITDGLTQVNNHGFFKDRLSEEFRRAQRYNDPLALALLDVDHFKDINDGYGHQVGDEVLKEVAASIKRSVRETDMVARCGGEEFAILFPKTQLPSALIVVDRIWKDLSNHKIRVGDLIRVTASIGVSGFPQRSVVSPDRLFRTADEALYRAKREGRNRICLYQADAFSHPTEVPGEIVPDFGAEPSTPEVLPGAVKSTLR
jgi:diguanylate cyclase (GGDEF)-like protein